jgi:predicted acylesterase/phospholipase RssA
MNHRIIMIAKSLILVSLLTVVNAEDKICRALALAGGANKGAYEAGVIYGLNHLLDPADYAWDVVSGVSAGAMNSAAIALFAPEDGVEMSEFLGNFTLNLTNADVYKEWPHGYKEGLLFRSGIFDNSPLLNTITNTFKTFGSLKRKLHVAAVDANSGDYVTFDDRDTTFEDFPLRIIASGSVPFIFPHRHIDNMTLMDGGTVWNTNIVSAIERCLTMVDSQEQIILDVVLCDNAEVGDDFNETESDTIDNFMRYYSIHSYNKALVDVAEFIKAYPAVKMRSLFIPSGKLTSGADELRMDINLTGPMFLMGIKDVKTYINLTNTDATSQAEKLSQWYDSYHLRNTVKLSDFIYQ